MCMCYRVYKYDIPTCQYSWKRNTEYILMNVQVVETVSWIPTSAIIWDLNQRFIVCSSLIYFSLILKEVFFSFRLLEISNSFKNVWISAPGTNEYWTIRVKCLSRGNLWSRWRGSNSRLSSINMMYESRHRQNIPLWVIIVSESSNSSIYCRFRPSTHNI